jgi:predicted CopG family antitoxin
MATTIQVSDDLIKVLKEKKLEGESYEDLIWNLIEDTQEISRETEANILLSRKQYLEGKVLTHEQVKKRLGI